MQSRVQVRDQFVIDQRRSPVVDAADFPKSALRVEVTGACRRVVGIEADGVAGPRAGDSPALPRASPGRYLCAERRLDSHRGQIQAAAQSLRSTTCRWPTVSSSPGERANELRPLCAPRRRATCEREQDAFLGYVGRPVATAEFGETIRDGRVQLRDRLASLAWLRRASLSCRSSLHAIAPPRTAASHPGSPVEPCRRRARLAIATSILYNLRSRHVRVVPIFLKQLALDHPRSTRTKLNAVATETPSDSRLPLFQSERVAMQPLLVVTGRRLVLVVVTVPSGRRAGDQVLRLPRRRAEVP